MTPSGTILRTPAKYIALGRSVAEEQLAHILALTKGTPDEPAADHRAGGPRRRSPRCVNGRWRACATTSSDTVLPFSKHYRELFQREGLKARDLRRPADLRRLPFTSKLDFQSARRRDPVRDFVLVPDPRSALAASRHDPARAHPRASARWRRASSASTGRC